MDAGRSFTHTFDRRLLFHLCGELSFDKLEFIQMKTERHVRRFDLGEIGKATVTPQGFLMCPGFATRVGVFPYIDGDGNLRRELRHPDDVFDPESLITLKYAPFTLEHPPEMITPDNVAQYGKGHTTERVEVNREMVDVDIIIEHKDAIDAVNNGLRELSSGYFADIVEEEGTFNGAPYNFRQKNIRYNHLAGVKRGRAGPEVRMRLDSADAVMRTDEVSIPGRSEFGEEGGVSDSEGSTKRVVAGGKEWDLPAELADIFQDYTDRFDEMRAKLAQLEENMAKRTDKKDVDISQPGVSPQVKVEQQGPDGRSAPGKTPARPGTITGGPSAKSDDEMDDEDEHGVIGGVKPNSQKEGGKALADKEEESEDAEGDEKDPGDDKAGHEDFEAGSAGAGGGAAMSPVDQLKKDMAELKDKYDAAMGKLDAMSAASMSAGEAKPDRKDSVNSRIRARVKLERQAEKLVPFEVAKKFDSMNDEQIRKTVIKHRHPKADLDGKSEAYLQSRFDSILELSEEMSTESRSKVGRAMLGLVSQHGERLDSVDGPTLDVDGARKNAINASRELWKQPLSATKK